MSSVVIIAAIAPPDEDPELTRAPFAAPPIERFLSGEGRAAESCDDSWAGARPASPPPFPAQGLKEPRGNACC